MFNIHIRNKDRRNRFTSTVSERSEIWYYTSTLISSRLFLAATNNIRVGLLLQYSEPQSKSYG